jgi:hypothetical protein
MPDSIIVGTPSSVLTRLLDVTARGRNRIA